MSDLDRILKLASHGTADAHSQAPAEREMKEEIPTTEAVGEFAEPIYDLIDMHFEGDCQPVFDDLVRYLSGDQIEDFVADFRRNHDLPMGDDDENFGEAEIEEADIDEDNAFNSAAAEAAKRGDSHFEFNGKKYPVKMDKKTADGLTDDIEHLRKLSGI